MPQKKTRSTARSKKSPLRKPTAAAATVRRSALDRAVITELQVENRRLRTELAALRKRVTPTRPGPVATPRADTGVPTLPLVPVQSS